MHHVDPAPPTRRKEKKRKEKKTHLKWQQTRRSAANGHCHLDAERRAYSCAYAVSKCTFRPLPPPRPLFCRDHVARPLRTVLYGSYSKSREQWWESKPIGMSFGAGLQPGIGEQLRYCARLTVQCCSWAVTWAPIRICFHSRV